MSQGKYSQEVRDIVARLTLMDDEFMSVAFDNNIPATELVLRIILNRDDLTVQEVSTQKSFSNLQGHNLKLDILATDISGKLYNIEIQNDSAGASVQRARYHSAILDANSLPPGQDFRQLPETYVVFIAREDVLKRGLPIYHINRIIEEDDTPFGDGAHIIYVNGACREDTSLGRLMDDFHSSRAEGMHYPVLQGIIKRFKDDNKEDDTMCAMVEEYARKRADEAWKTGRTEGRTEGEALGRKEGKEEAISALLRAGVITPEQAALTVNIPLEQAKRLASSV